MRNGLASVFAVVVIALSNAAVADDPANSNAIRLSDAELDTITAGTTTMVHVILNAGNAGDSLIIPRGKDTHLFCINCTAFGGGVEGPAQGAHVLLNQGKGLKIRCFGGSSLVFC